MAACCVNIKAGFCQGLIQSFMFSIRDKNNKHVNLYVKNNFVLKVPIPMHQLMTNYKSRVSLLDNNKISERNFEMKFC